jgi:protein-disulfide isomerase
MQVSRRFLLQVGGFTTAAGLLPSAARAESSDPRMADRAIGSATAPVRVDEFFSLTCPHCAAFHRQTMPQVRKELIDTGKLRMVFHDFPLDQLALTASAVARALPAERYEPFVAALLASQDRWAFARGVNATEELWKMAALAGLSRETFNAAIADTALKNAILQGQDEAQKTYQIDSTPSFIFNGPHAKNTRETGDLPYSLFAERVAKAA